MINDKSLGSVATGFRCGAWVVQQSLYYKFTVKCVREKNLDSVNIWQTHRKKVDCLTHPAVCLGSQSPAER